MLGLIFPQLPCVTAHDAIPLLQGYTCNGCPVNCGLNWSREHIEMMIIRGSHRKALAINSVHQLRQENRDKVAQLYARMMQWGNIKHNCPSKLKVSPMAMIPHNSKLYRCILDLSCKETQTCETGVHGTTWPRLETYNPRDGSSS